jgi:hypothetical protein
MLLISSADGCCSAPVAESNCESDGCGDHQGCAKDELLIQFIEDFVPAERSQVDVPLYSLSVCTVSVDLDTEIAFTLPQENVSTPIDKGKIYLTHSCLVLYG